MKKRVTVNLNRRTGPSVNYPIDGIYLKDTTVNVIATGHHWSLVHTGAWPVAKNKMFWVSSGYLSDEIETAVFPTHWPCDSRQVNMSNLYGARVEEYAQWGLKNGHEGIDIHCPIGHPYYAIADGVVIRTGDKKSDGEPSAYGYHVIIDHENGYTSLYAHSTTQVLYEVGQRVKGGQIVAYSGNTGNSTGPHLHITIKHSGRYVDPLPILEPVKQWQK